MGLTHDRNLNQSWHLPVLMLPTTPSDNSKNEHTRQRPSFQGQGRWRGTLHRAAHPPVLGVQIKGLLQKGKLCCEEGGREQQLRRAFNVVLGELGGLPIISKLDGAAPLLLHHRLWDSRKETLSLGHEGLWLGVSLSPPN